jgi:uncharacterized membrane protein YbhN (UPF0104 family)
VLIDPPRRRTAGSVTRAGLAGLVAAAVVLLLVRQRTMLEAGSDSVAGADPLWLGPAALGTVALWTAGTVSQLGSLPARVPVGRLFAVQMAGTFVNHVLPAGVGGMAVNARFLTRHGIPPAAAAGAIGINLAAGAITHTALLAAALLLAPSALTGTVGRGGSLLDGVTVNLRGGWPAVAAAGAVLLAAAVARRVAPALRERLAHATGQVRAQVAVQVQVLRTPARAVQLWAGSVAVPILHCLTLYAVLRSLGGTVPVLDVSVAYLVASSLAALLPSPGGFGALDVALVAALVAVGAPAAVALASVLAYRLLTVWLPLLPGACVLAVLLHRKVI